MSDSRDLLLQCRHVSKAVTTQEGSLTILHDIDLAIGAGETVAIVGTSGSGKTTLLGLLAGLDLPTSGEVQFNDQTLSAMDEDQRAQWRGDHVGFVFQNFELVPALNALENVMLPAELRGAGDAEARAREELTAVGLGERLQHYPHQLSGGEQQRVAIARAFVTRPTVLFADEPTGNLDLNSGATIMDLLFQLNREHGTTLVLVTHDEKLAQRCDRVLHLEAGRLVNLEHAA